MGVKIRPGKRDKKIPRLHRARVGRNITQIHARIAIDYATAATLRDKLEAPRFHYAGTSSRFCARERGAGNAANRSLATSRSSNGTMVFASSW